MKKIIEIIMIGIALGLSFAACRSAIAETETVAKTTELSATACAQELAPRFISAFRVYGAV